MKIFSLIAGIACIIIALVMFLIGSVIGGIILLLIGAINLFLYVKNKNKPKETETYVPEALKYDDHEFYVAGSEYNQEVISELLTMKNEEYSLPKSKFLEEVFDRVYQYDIEYLPAQLVDEPENEYDPKAIAVYVYEDRIGYIAKSDQEAVRSLQIDHLEAEIYGGKYKEPGDDEVITGETPYKAKLHVYVK